MADAAVDVVRSVAGVPVEIEVLPDGEPSELLDNQEQLFRRFAGRRLERGDPLIALGDDALSRPRHSRRRSGSAGFRSSRSR